MTRAEQERAIARHVGSPSDMTDEGVALVWDLVFALCWCRETHELAVEQMRPVIKAVLEERRTNALQAEDEEPTP